jgi:hypothetical protein
MSVLLLIITVNITLLTLSTVLTEIYLCATVEKLINTDEKPITEEVLNSMYV